MCQTIFKWQSAGGSHTCCWGLRARSEEHGAVSKRFLSWLHAPCSLLTAISMSDQAFKLRALIQRAAPAAPVAPVGLPMIVVSGGRAGVGATTVAVNLAAVLADRGEQVALVDAAGPDGNMDAMAGIA